MEYFRKIMKFIYKKLKGLNGGSGYLVMTAGRAGGLHCPFRPFYQLNL